MRPQETGTGRRRAGPLLLVLARVQKSRGASWAHALILGPRLLWRRRAWRHTKRTKQGPFGFSEAPAICAQPCATDQIAKHPGHVPVVAVVIFQRNVQELRQVGVAAVGCRSSCVYRDLRAEDSCGAYELVDDGWTRRGDGAVDVDYHHSRTPTVRQPLHDLGQRDEKQEHCRELELQEWSGQIS